MEAYKMIRTNLLFSLATKESRAVVFSSAEPSAGKSTLSANLAIVMAQTGARVVLVDADMRKPTQHRNFQLSRTMGLSKILGGLATVEECIHKEVKPNVDVILSGPTPPNPSELLGSNRMDNVLKQLREFFDYIIIDLPPVNIVSDAVAISHLITGMIVVIREDYTEKKELERCMRQLKLSNVKVLGTVLNGSNTGAGYYNKYRKYRYYKYYKYYRYYSSDAAGKKK
jgi:capsular exopolysaccharide synthesis family protein